MMKNLIVATLVVSLAVGTITIVRHNGKSESRLAGNDQSVPLSSEKIVSHTDKEVIDAQCSREDGTQWELEKPIGCESSPDGKFIAKFFYNGPATHDRYYELFVINTVEGSVKRIWAGDFRTLGWDWKENNKMEIKYNCGTACQATKTMDVNESASITDYRDGRMSEENGWRIKITKSF